MFDLNCARGSAPLMIFTVMGVLNFMPRIVSTLALTSRTSASASACVSAETRDGGGASARAPSAGPSKAAAITGATQVLTGRDYSCGLRALAEVHDGEDQPDDAHDAEQP